MEQKQFSRDEVIFREGEISLCMYDLISGRVGIYASYGTQEQRLLTELQAGQMFGEMGMIEFYPRSATAVALEDTVLEVITPDTFNAYFREKPDQVLRVMRQLSARLRELTDDYVDACRAVAEVAQADPTVGKKSGWFKSHFRKFMEVLTAEDQSVDMNEYMSFEAYW